MVDDDDDDDDDDDEEEEEEEEEERKKEREKIEAKGSDVVIMNADRISFVPSLSPATKTRPSRLPRGQIIIRLPRCSRSEPRPSPPSLPPFVSPSHRGRSRCLLFFGA